MTNEDTKRQAVAEALALVESGMSANKAATQIAEPLNTTSRTVKRWAQQAGTPLGEASQDTAQNAREVAEAQFKAKRAALKVKMADRVDWILDRFVEPHIDYRGRDAKQVHFDEASSQDLRNYAVAVGVLMDKIRLEEGEVTSRTERINYDELDRQIRQLEREVAAAGQV